MRFSTLIAALVAALLSVAVLTGCSGDDGDDEGDGAPSGGGVDFLGDLGEPAAIQFRLVSESDATDVDCAEPTAAPADRSASGCDPSGLAYVLDPAAFETTVESAESDLDPSTGAAVVTVTLPAPAAADLSVLSTQYAGGEQRVALFVEGRVVSAPVFSETIDDGALQITGGDLTPEIADGIVAALT